MIFFVVVEGIGKFIGVEFWMVLYKGHLEIWREVNKVSVRLAFGWILAPENLKHPLQY